MGCVYWIPCECGDEYTERLGHPTHTEEIKVLSNSDQLLWNIHSGAVSLDSPRSAFPRTTLSAPISQPTCPPLRLPKFPHTAYLLTHFLCHPQYAVICLYNFFVYPPNNKGEL